MTLERGFNILSTFAVESYTFPNWDMKSDEGNIKVKKHLRSFSGFPLFPYFLVQNFKI